MRFRNLKKKATSSTDPSAITTPPVSQIPSPTINPFVELEATMVVQPSPSDVPSLGKRKEKELTMRMPRKLKRKMGEGSSGVAADL